VLKKLKRVSTAGLEEALFAFLRRTIACVLHAQ
jgi:hypothetical protein